MRLRGSVTMKVAEEIALGEGTSIEPGEVFLLGPAAFRIASAVFIPSIECNDTVMTLASALQTEGIDISNGCSLDVDEFTLRMDGALSASSVSPPPLQMNSQSSRLIVDGDVDVAVSSSTALTAGTLSATGAVTLTHFLDGSAVTSDSHTVILSGNGPQTLTSNGTLARIEATSPSSTLALSSFVVDSIDLGSTSLCVDVAGGDAPVAAEVTTTSGFSYAGGPGWTVGSCSGPGCTDLENGGTAASCP